MSHNSRPSSSLKVSSPPPPPATSDSSLNKQSRGTKQRTDLMSSASLVRRPEASSRSRGRGVGTTWEVMWEGMWEAATMGTEISEEEISEAGAILCRQRLYSPRQTPRLFRVHG